MMRGRKRKKERLDKAVRNIKKRRNGSHKTANKTEKKRGEKKNT